MASEELPDLLNKLEAELSTDAYNDAANTLDRIRATYNEIEVKETIKFRQVTALRKRRLADSSTDRELLDEFAEVNSSIELARSMLLSGTGTYLLDPENGERSELFEMISELRELEEEYLETERKVEPLLANASLSGQAEIVDVDLANHPHLKGSPFPITVTVKNIGDDKTENRSVVHESDANITPSSQSFKPLSAEATTKLRFEVVADETGDFSATFSFKDGENHTDQRIAFEVLGKTDLIDNTDEILESLQIRIKETAEITGGFEKSLLKKLGAAEASLQRARQLVTEGREKQADNQLNTTSRQLGAFLNSFEGQATKGNRDPSNTLIRYINQQTEAAIDIVVAAKDAVA